MARLVDTARAGKARARVAFGLLGALTLVGAAAAAGLAGAGDRLAALLAAISALVAVAGLALAGRLAQRTGSAARRDLGERLPGLDLSPAGLERLGSRLPAARSLHHERRQQAALAEVQRADQSRARTELEGLVDRCLGLAREAGVVAPDRPQAGSRSEALLETAGAALTAVDEVARLATRRRELEMEDAGLAVREAQLAAFGEEAARTRAAAEAVEARIRRATASAGVNPGLPPLAAVAAFRDGCAHRREHDRLAAALAEVRRRQRVGGADLETIARQRSELAAELRRRGGSPDGTAEDLPVDAGGLDDLERAAASALELAATAATAARTLEARIEGLSGGLPSLPDLEDERLTVTAARDRALRQQEALQRTMAMIDAAGRDVHERLAPRLAESVSNRLALLTGDRYADVNVDVEHFAVALASGDRDQLVGLDLVSHGTRDQVALLLRLALCEVLGEAGESMPLLLDEPLASADPARRRGLLEFLSQLSATNQLVVTTTDPGIAATLVGLGDPESTAIIDLGMPGALAEPAPMPPEPSFRPGSVG